MHASAIEFSEDWGDSYPYADLGDPKNKDATSIATGGLNDYKYGKLGIWRPERTYVYQIDRVQQGSTPHFESTINEDGNYQEFYLYDWDASATNPKWDWVSEITRYSPYGYAIEERSRLSAELSSTGTEQEVYSSQMYGYDNSTVIAKSANASYFEIGYIGFEQGSSTDDVVNSGHIGLSSTGTLDVVSTKTHSGENSLSMTDGLTTYFTVSEFSTSAEELMGVASKDYIVSCWVNVEESGSYGTLSDGTTTVSTDDFGEVIDGWKKLELKVTMPASGDLTISYTSNGNTYLDDLRFGPFDGGMMTYVYDRERLWLLAEMDGLNYATFYNYDEEGNLVQVKKETEKGIVTVKTARSNTQQQ